MSNRKRQRSNNTIKRQQQQEQAQKDYEAFKQWSASGEAEKPITADELQRMLLLAYKIK